VQALRECHRLYERGERRVDVLERVARGVLQETNVEYVAFVDRETLVPDVEHVDARTRLLIAARVGETRLIDNCGLAEGVP
jgi:pantothenate synthetase